MDTPDGPLWESNAIARYVCRKGDRGLLGTNDYEASLVDQWLDWIRSKVEDAAWTLIGPIFGYSPFVQEKHDSAKATLKKVVTIVNSHLEKQQYMVGTRVTLADIVVYVSLQSCIKYVFDPEYLKPFPHLVAWVHRPTALPQFKEVIKGGNLKFAEKELGANALSPKDKHN